MERGWKYGDGLFETIRIHKGKPLWLDYHLSRLKKGMETLGFQPSFVLEESFLYEKLPLDAKNGRLRLTFIRKSGGLYAPKNNDVEVISDYKKLDREIYELNKKGLVLNSSFNLRLPLWTLSGLKTCNALPYVLAAQHAERTKVDDTLIFNALGEVAEASSANIFFIKNGIFYTTLDNCGAINGVMQKVLISFFKNKKIPFQQKKITIDDLYSADELFLTNSIKGIQSVISLDEIFFEKTKTIDFLQQFKSFYSF